MQRKRLVPPPLKDRHKVLNQYYEDINNIDPIDALVKYKNLMQILYVRYNPGMKTTRFTREFYDKKEEDY
jgi:metal-dependent HD superfamily phosphatase/phosphodiesterase